MCACVCACVCVGVLTKIQLCMDSVCVCCVWVLAKCVCVCVCVPIITFAGLHLGFFHWEEAYVCKGVLLTILHVISCTLPYHVPK